MYPGIIHEISEVYSHQPAKEVLHNCSPGKMKTKVSPHQSGTLQVTDLDLADTSSLMP